LRYQEELMIDIVGIAETNEEIAPGYRLLRLKLDQDVEVRPGQFAMLKPRRALEPLLRRALAVYRVDGPRRVSFLYQVLGRGTEALSQIGDGGEVETLLPLGNSWPIPSKEERAIVVAGGIGSASVLMLCEELQRAGVSTRVFFGAANARTAVGCGLGDFRAYAFPLVLSTVDGSLGERGFVSAPLERFLKEDVGSGATIYACGPWGMMKRVAELADQFEVHCLVSLEAPMGCGFGVCVGCVVAVKTDGPLGYSSYKRVCTDGSIFEAKTVRWEINAMGH
jgi:dihydroorotate dehydrogenase electron transfer subunit